MRLDGQWIEVETDKRGDLTEELPREGSSLDVFSCRQELCQAWLGLPRGDYLLGIRAEQVLGYGSWRDWPHSTPPNPMEKLVIRLAKPLKEAGYLNFTNVQPPVSLPVEVGTSSVVVPFASRQIDLNYPVILLFGSEPFEKSKFDTVVLDVESMQESATIKLSREGVEPADLQPIPRRTHRFRSPGSYSWLQELPEAEVWLEFEGPWKRTVTQRRLTLRHSLRPENMGSQVAFPDQTNFTGQYSFHAYHEIPKGSAADSLGVRAVYSVLLRFALGWMDLPQVVKPRTESFRANGKEIYLGRRWQAANLTRILLEATIGEEEKKLIYVYLPQDQERLSLQLLDEGLLEGRALWDFRLVSVEDFILPELSSRTPQAYIHHTALYE